MAWLQYDSGTTLGSRGSENGIVLLDEEEDSGARITLERDCRHAPFAVTCGIYGWMFHTRYLGREVEVGAEVGRMKDELGVILDMIPTTDDPDLEAKAGEVTRAIGHFVDRFP